MYSVLDWESCSDESDEEGEWIDVHHSSDEEAKVRLSPTVFRILWFAQCLVKYYSWSSFGRGAAYIFLKHFLFTLDSFHCNLSPIYKLKHLTFRRMNHRSAKKKDWRRHRLCPAIVFWQQRNLSRFRRDKHWRRLKEDTGRGKGKGVRRRRVEGKEVEEGRVISRRQTIDNECEHTVIYYKYILYSVCVNFD